METRENNKPVLHIESHNTRFIYNSTDVPEICEVDVIQTQGSFDLAPKTDKQILSAEIYHALDKLGVVITGGYSPSERKYFGPDREYGTSRDFETCDEAARVISGVFGILEEDAPMDSPFHTIRICLPQLSADPKASLLSKKSNSISHTMRL